MNSSDTQKAELEIGRARAEELGLKIAYEMRAGFNGYLADPFSGKSEGGVEYRSPKIDMYSADDIHRLLGAGVEAWAHFKTDKPRYWGPRENGQFDDTHTGLVIGIRPIVKESREQKLEGLLREVCEFVGGAHDSYKRHTSIVERAKKLLGLKE